MCVFLLFQLFLDFGKVFLVKDGYGKQLALKKMKRSRFSKNECEIFEEVSRKRNSHYFFHF